MKEETKKKTSSAKKKTTTTAKNKTTSTKSTKAKTISAKSTKAPAKKAAVKTTTKKVAKAKETKKEEVKVTPLVEEKKEIKKEAKPKKVEKKETKKVEKVAKVKEEKKDNFFKENKEITNLLKIVLAVTAIFLVFYAVTYMITAANKKKADEDTKNVEIDYYQVLMSNMLGQSRSEYYVLATEKEDNYASTYTTLTDLYKGKENALSVYKVDLSSKFNASYYDKTLETSVIDSDLSKLKVNASTLFKVRGGQIVESYVGHEQIVNHLNSVLK